MKAKLVYAGRGLLNLVVLLVVVFGLRSMIRGHVSDVQRLEAISVAVVVSYLAGVRWIEHRQASELAPQRSFAEFATGLLLGMSLFTILMVVLWLSDVYHPSKWGGFAPLFGGFWVALLTAINEEIVFRGLLFRLSQKILGVWGALALTSLLFGAAHAFNHGATVGSSLAIALEAGILLGSAYALTQRLWLPIGLHLGWNFAEGSIFGMSVSGGGSRGSLITGTLQGRNLVTGGSFGPEASIVAVAVSLAASLFLLWKVVHLGRAEPQP
ncbi:MAG: CPBP family intramembrane glutamic endopeptidase [Candidatus Sulfotelmatobacter sp.]